MICNQCEQLQNNFDPPDNFKLLEKTINKQLMDHLESNNLLSDVQYI